MRVVCVQDATELVAKLRAFHYKAQTQSDKKHLAQWGLDLVEGEVRNNVEAGVLEPAMSKTKMIQVGKNTHMRTRTHTTQSTVPDIDCTVTLFSLGTKSYKFQLLLLTCCTVLSSLLVVHGFVSMGWARGGLWGRWGRGT